MTGMKLIRCESIACSSASLRTWSGFAKIKAEGCPDYLLCILGKEGYVAMDCCVPPDQGHKQDPEKFLDYIESTLDDEIFPTQSLSMNWRMSRRGLMNLSMNS